MSRNTIADAEVRTTDSGVTASDSDGDDERPVRRATRVVRLLKLAATTLAALVGVGKALGLV